MQVHRVQINAVKLEKKVKERMASNSVKQNMMRNKDGANINALDIPFVAIILRNFAQKNYIGNQCNVMRNDESLTSNLGNKICRGCIVLIRKGVLYNVPNHAQITNSESL